MKKKICVKVRYKYHFSGGTNTTNKIVYVDELEDKTIKSEIYKYLDPDGYEVIKEIISKEVIDE